MIRSHMSAIALPIAAALVAGCAQTLGSNPASLPQARPGATLQVIAGRLVGPAAVLSDRFGGPIYGWSIDENGNDGVLSEVFPPSGPFSSYVETFDQTRAKIVKIVRKQSGGSSGGRELFVDSILANDVGLIDDERRNAQKHTTRDVWYTMAPVTGNKITGTWTSPPGERFLIWDVADQQLDPDAVMATTIDPVITQPPIFQVIVANVASNKILRVLHAPRLDGVNYPYLVAEDTTTHHAYVPAANYHSQTVFVDFNVRTGAISNKFVAPAFSGPVQGIAIDSASHMMCTTTGTSYSVQMYDLTTRKQTFVGQIPNAGGEGQAGTSIAADPIDHLFLIEQPNSLLGGSEVYVYDEKGNVRESLSGFQFTDESGIQLVASGRSGYVAGPNDNQLTSFTY